MYVFMGGTFDPVHRGHIEGALQVSALFDECQVHLLPTKMPVHKSTPLSNTEQRVAMLHLATSDYEQLVVDVREVESAEASYTINTLKQLRQELGEREPLVMVIGMDSFLTLPNWQNAADFMSLCHIVVLQRPQYELVRSEQLSEFLQHQVVDKKALSNSACGSLLLLTQPPIDICATQIRQDLIGDKLTENFTQSLPQEVRDYIRKNKLYRKLI